MISKSIGLSSLVAGTEIRPLFDKWRSLRDNSSGTLIPAACLESAMPRRGRVIIARLIQPMPPVLPFPIPATVLRCCDPLEPVLEISRLVLRRGRAAGFVAPRLQISGEYAPSSRLAIHPAALAIPFPTYFKNRLLDPEDDGPPSPGNADFQQPLPSQSARQ